jgi:predicted DNA-binding protein (UPF0251 family)
VTPRSVTPRKVFRPPDIKGFKPYGVQTGKTENDAVNLLQEEYEALRLSDYVRCTHEEAAIEMGVSRPTFTRIYASALQKIARAFVEGRQIQIQGGHVYFDSSWFYCTRCRCHFNEPHMNSPPGKCPLCGDPNVRAVEVASGKQHLKIQQAEMVFVCDRCRIEQIAVVGEDLPEPVCEVCLTPMRPRIGGGCTDEKSCL